MTRGPDRPGASARSSTRARRVGAILGSTLVVAVPLVVVAGVYLERSVVDPALLPVGEDTAGYITRASAVHDLGLEALTRYAERPGHPIVTSLLRSVSGATPLDMARVGPALIAVAIALAGVTIGVNAAGARSWVTPALGVGIGASSFVALTAIGHASNLLFDALALAAVALSIHVGAGHRGAGALIVLIVAASITHWMFAIGLVGLLALSGTWLLVGSRMREGRIPPADGRPGRLLLVVAIGSLLALAAVLLSAGVPDRGVPTEFVNEARGKIEALRTATVPELTLPLAAAGAAIAFLWGVPATRRAAAPLSLWAAAAPVALFGWYVLDVPSPPHRIVPVALGVPALIVLGAGATGWWMRERLSADGDPIRRIVGAAAGGLVVAAAAGWLASAGTDTWSLARPGFTVGAVNQASTLSTYLRRFSSETVVVLAVDDRGHRPLRALRVVLPSDRLDSLVLVATDLQDGGRALRREVATSLPPGTVAVYLRAYNRRPAPDGVALGPGVVLMVGPSPPGPISPDPSSSTSGELIRVSAISVAMLIAVGLGWSLVLTDLGPVGALSLSPSVGLAVLAIGGLAAGRLGAPVGGGGGVIVASLIGMTGWLSAALSHLRSRRSERT